MYECCIGIKIIWRHWSTTTITTMADHSRRQQKLPPSAAHKALHPAPSSLIDGRQPPEPADLSDVTTMHHRRNKGALWGTYTPPTPPKLYPLARGIFVNQYDASARGAMPRVGCSGGIFAVAAGARTTFSGWTTAQWVSPESSCLEQDDSCIEPRRRRRDKREKKINGIQTSIPHVGMPFI